MRHAPVAVAVLVFLALGPRVVSPRPVAAYDTFSGDLIASSKWCCGELVREVRGGKLYSEIQARSAFTSNSLSASSPAGIISLRAEVAVSAIATPSTDGLAEARLWQKIYNDGSSTTAGVGDIRVSISIAQRASSALFVRMVVFRCGDPGCAVASGQPLLDEPLAGASVALGQPAILSVTWDGAVLTFDANGVQHAVNPALLAPIARPVPDAPGVQVGTAAAGVDSLVKATFDDVSLNGTVYDSFDTPTIDPGRWRALEFVREIQGGTVMLMARATSANGPALNDSLEFASPASVRGIAADTVLVSSMANTTVRLYGTWYNDGSGDIWAQIDIVNFGAGPRLRFNLSRCTSIACLSTTGLHTVDFGAAEIGRRYRMVLEWTGTVFRFGFDDDIRTFDPRGIAPVVRTTPTSVWRGLGLRLFSLTASPSAIRATLDNVAIGPSSGRDQLRLALSCPAVARPNESIAINTQVTNRTSASQLLNRGALAFHAGQWKLTGPRTARVSGLPVLLAPGETAGPLAVPFTMPPSARPGQLVSIGLVLLGNSGIATTRRVLAEEACTIEVQQ